MAPMQYKWFQILNKTFPITKTNGTSQALKRVVCDQVVYAPVGEEQSDFGTGEVQLGLFFFFFFFFNQVSGYSSPI